MAEIDAILERCTSLKDGGNLNGVAFIVKDKAGKTLYSKAYGKLDFQSERPMSTDAVCSIFSMTKLATAVSALQCVEKGLITLDEDVGKYVPFLRDVEIIEGFDDNDKPI